jgi:hypothetical protein
MIPLLFTFSLASSTPWAQERTDVCPAYPQQSQGKHIRGEGISYSIVQPVSDAEVDVPFGQPSGQASPPATRNEQNDDHSSYPWRGTSL